jgi:hypothetical protein
VPPLRSPRSQPTGPATSPPRFVGRSLALRFLPWLLIAVGLLTAIANAGAVLFGVFLVVLGVFARVALPWRFVVVDEGVALWFGFGRRRFLAKDDVTVRVEFGDVRVLPNSERFGYLLTDGVSNRRAPILRAVLEEHGFRIVRSSVAPPDSNVKLWRGRTLTARVRERASPLPTRMQAARGWFRRVASRSARSHGMCSLFAQVVSAKDPRRPRRRAFRRS